MDGLFDVGINLIEWLQTWPESLDGFMAFISFMGTIEFYLLLIPFVYWAIDPRLGIRVLLLLIGTDFVGSFAKQLFHQPRPYWLSETVIAKSTEISYGLPSTHASGSLTVWGALSVKIRRYWLTGFSLAIIILVALSRLYLGVHFPHDILGGWLIGVAGLVLILHYEDDILTWFRRATIGQQLYTALIMSAIMALAGWLLVTSLASNPDPESWSSFAIEARSASHYFTIAGTFFGAVAGYVLVREQIGFEHRVPWVWRMGRYGVGIVITLAIWQGLDMLFGLLVAEETTLAFLLRYVRYAAVAFWITYGAPRIFQDWIRPSLLVTTGPDSQGLKNVSSRNL